MHIDPECPVDLHTHTTASDGSLSPEDLVYLARSGGLCAIAVTDHDTTNGVIRAMEAGERAGVLVIPAVEISTQHKPGSMHILGYFIDVGEHRLQNTLAEMVRNRDRRNRGIVERLNNLGVQMTLEEVAEYAGGDVLGRPHFARALVEKGV
ncbi:MAG TPA: PHP domain-containing protein, partial [Candidatus Latescibacteria bacterium]|nr:PHP domain-containing protein [Candidatus Latescibacterota bacterium]